MLHAGLWRSGIGQSGRPNRPALAGRRSLDQPGDPDRAPNFHTCQPLARLLAYLDERMCSPSEGAV